MSSLIFHTTSTLALVATDTLTVSPDDNIPFMYSTKAFILPHLRLLICGTGVVALLNNWFSQVNSGAVVRDINHLNAHAGQALQNSWADLTDNFPGILSDTTIYHFGFPSNGDSLHSYAYRSTTNFRSEKLIYGTGTKPPVSLKEDLSLPNDLRHLMEMQRKQELEKPVEDRVSIGGEIILYILRPDDFRISIHDRFDDYESDLKTMFKRLEHS